MFPLCTWRSVADAFRRYRDAALARNGLRQKFIKNYLSNITEKRNRHKNSKNFNEDILLIIDANINVHYINIVEKRKHQKW